MDQKFFVEYLIEEEKVSYCIGRHLKSLLEEENYEEVEETLKDYLHEKGYDIDQINFPERCISVKELLTKMARWLQTQVKRWKK